MTNSKKCVAARYECGFIARFSTTWSTRAHTHKHTHTHTQTHAGPGWSHPCGMQAAAGAFRAAFVGARLRPQPPRQGERPAHPHCLQEWEHGGAAAPAVNAHHSSG
eukprot:1159095-Pelagomonas_calceolata.AAC.13